MKIKKIIIGALCLILVGLTISSCSSEPNTGGGLDVNMPYEENVG